MGVERTLLMEVETASLMEAGAQGSVAADAQCTLLEEAEAQMAAFAVRSCSIWIAKLNQALGSASDSLSDVAEICQLRPWRNLTTIVLGLVMSPSPV